MVKSKGRNEKRKKAHKAKINKDSRSSSTLSDIDSDKDSDKRINSVSIHPRHNFTTNLLDHCETPKVAYEHIREVLLKLFRVNSTVVKAGHETQSKQTKHLTNEEILESTKIWDPYYCNGSTKRFLNELGFQNVLHENTNFYKLIESRQIPNHDVFLTNPPYSEDHIQRLFGFLNNSTKRDDMKPFCLLLPNWVARKREYKSWMTLNEDNSKEVDVTVAPSTSHERAVVYLSPIRPYTYTMPSWMTSEQGRPSHVGADGRTTPYLSSWYISARTNEETEWLFQELIQEEGQLRRNHHGSQHKSGNLGWVVAKTIQGLKWKIQKATRSTNNRNP